MYNTTSEAAKPAENSKRSTYKTQRNVSKLNSEAILDGVAAGEKFLDLILDCLKGIYWFYKLGNSFQSLDCILRGPPAPPVRMFYELELPTTFTSWIELLNIRANL